MSRFVRLLLLSVISFCATVLPATHWVHAQTTTPRPEVEILRKEMQEMKTLYEERMKELQERLKRLEETSAPVAASASTPSPQSLEEKEVILAPPTERENLLETLGLPKPEIAGAKIGGFFVGSLSYNSDIQMVPEFAGGVEAKADHNQWNFRFDKFAIGFSKVFAPWLSASAAIEVESHRDRHTHLIGKTDETRFGCPTGRACERFGAEAAETEVVLDKFALTAIAPIGNGLSLSLARFDIPFGIERHDEPFLLQATTSEVFRFGRPQKGTGFQASYTFAPWLDATAFVVNRWESETTEDDFNDNNRKKSFGGRLGFTPLPVDGLLNIGLGGFYGAEQDNNDPPFEDDDAIRWVLDFDFTWTPIPKLLFAGEFVYGQEDQVHMRERGEPIAAREVTKDVSWLGFYLTTHYDLLDWLGLTFRYGYFHDVEGGRTGVEQVLQSITFAPIIHLSSLIPDLRPMGVTYPRTRHPLHWVDLKLEYRYNFSNEPVFGHDDPNQALFNRGDDSSHQIQLQLVVNY